MESVISLASFDQINVFPFLFKSEIGAEIPAKLVINREYHVHILINRLMYLRQVGVA